MQAAGGTPESEVQGAIAGSEGISDTVLVIGVSMGTAGDQALGCNGAGSALEIDTDTAKNQALVNHGIAGHGTAEQAGKKRTAICRYWLLDG